MAETPMKAKRMKAWKFDAAIGPRGQMYLLHSSPPYTVLPGYRIARVLITELPPPQRAKRAVRRRKEKVND
jgi:hypothetical protein